MADHHNGNAGIPADLHKQIHDLPLNGAVQGRGGLVGDQKLGAVHQRHGNIHALAHTAGKLPCIRVQNTLRVIKADLAQQCLGPRQPLPQRALAVAHIAVGDLLADFEHGVQIKHRVLRHKANVLSHGSAPVGVG